MTEDEWLNRTPQKITVDDFKEFSNGLFKTVRDRINSNKEKAKK